MKDNLFTNKMEIPLVTVEPVLFLTFMVMGFQTPANSAIVYKKVCLHLTGYDYDINCDDTSNNTEEVIDEIQRTTSYWFFYETLCINLPAFFAVTFYGSWSDTFSRRLPIILPLLGYMLSTTNYLIMAIFMKETPVAMFLVGSLLYGMFGGILTFIMSTFSYLTSVCSEKGRTIRVSIAESMMFVGTGVASFVSGLIIDATSFTFMYSLCLGVLVVTALYVALWLKEPHNMNTSNVTSVKDSKDAEEPQPDDLQVQVVITSFDKARETWKSKLYARFHPRNAKGTLLVVFVPRQENRRMQLILMASCIFMMSLSSYMSFQYLFLVKPPISMTTTLYGYFSGYYTLVGGVGLLIVVPIMKKFGKIPDPIVMVTGCLSKIGYCVMMAFSTQLWSVFLSPLVGIIHSAPYPSVRAVGSTLVEKDEHGKLFSVIATLESLGSLLASLMFGRFIYPLTVDSFAGTCYLLAAGIVVVPTFIFTWLHFDMKRRGEYESFKRQEEFQVEVPSVAEGNIEEDNGYTSNRNSELPEIPNAGESDI